MCIGCNGVPSNVLQRYYRIAEAYQAISQVHFNTSCHLHHIVVSENCQVSTTPLCIVAAMFILIYIYCMYHDGHFIIIVKPVHVHPVFFFYCFLQSRNIP